MTKAAQVNVHLARNWFAPGAVRFRAGDYEDFPQHLLASLPSSATVNDGSGPMKADEWQAKKKLEVPVPEAEVAASTLVDPGAPGSASPPTAQAPADGESMSPASPKSSGPETQALPGQEVKTGEQVTASGTKPADKAAEIAGKKAGKDSKFDI
jgi:hypothetical protein